MEFEDDIDALYATYQSLLPMAEADSERLWQKFRLDWNYDSNKIEGNTLTKNETKALLIDGIEPMKMRKDIFQMQSHDKAIDVLRDLAKSERLLTESDIRALHKTALGENYTSKSITSEGDVTRKVIKVGEYKTAPNIVLTSDGSTHEYASPQDVPIRMAKTIKRLRQYLKKPDMPLHDYLAELHQDFIETHPFDDGNGRVVRLLLNYVCLHLGWPPVIIKSEKRSEYISTLEKWNRGSEESLRDLIKRELTWSLKKSIAAARGENIEDDGDLYKEIDFFVRENTPKFEKVIYIYDCKKMIEDVVVPIAIEMEAMIRKFSPLFEVSYEVLPHEAIHRNHINNERPEEQYIRLNYEMQNYLKENLSEVSACLVFKFKPDSCILQTKINSILKDGIANKSVIIEDDLLNFKNSKHVAEKSRAITKSIFETIKRYAA